jgi:accessory gene regulator protein AgrB
MKLLQMLLLLCALSLTMFALVGFVVWNLNPAEWTPFARLAAVILSVVSTGLAITEAKYRARGKA